MVKIVNGNIVPDEEAANIPTNAAEHHNDTTPSAPSESTTPSSLNLSSQTVQIFGRQVNRIHILILILFCYLLFGLKGVLFLLLAPLIYFCFMNGTSSMQTPQNVLPATNPNNGSSSIANNKSNNTQKGVRTLGDYKS